MPLPANVSTGWVRGQFIVGIVDGADVDQAPDAVGAVGTVTFTPSIPYAPDVTASPNPVTILPTSFVAVLDELGYVCTPVEGTLIPAYRGVQLIATDDPDLSVEGWTWTATYAFAPVKGSAINIPAHSFNVPSGGDIDLTTVVSVPASAGIGTEQIESLAASAQAAAVAAAAAAAAAEAAAGATDAGVADLISTDGTATADAVSALVVDAAADKVDESTKGAPNGVAPLGSDSRVPDANLPGRLSTTNLDGLYADKSVETGKVSVSDKGQPGGVAPLDGAARVPDVNLPLRLQDTDLSTKIDGRVAGAVNTAVPPAVSAYIANDPSVVNSASTMAQSNAGLIPKWKASTSYTAGQQVVSPDGDIISAKIAFTSGTTYSAANWNASMLETVRQVTLTIPGTSTDTRTAVGVGLPFKAPVNSTRYRFGFRNRNPKTGVVYPGALSFTAIGIGAAQFTGETVFAGMLSGNATTIQGAATTPADGSVYYTPYVSAVPLVAGTFYHLRYGYNGPAQTNYAGDGKSFTNAAPTSVLNGSPAGFTAATTAPLDVWLEAVTDGGSVKQVLYAGQAPAGASSTPGANASSRTKINTFGDSLTDGGANGIVWPETDSWPSKLATQLPGVTVTNHGYSGATVSELLFRTGIKQPRFTVVGGSIPSNGYANLTTAEDLGLDPSRAFSVAGKILGITGLWQRLAGGELRFNTYGAVGGPATTATGLQYFTPDTAATADPSATAIIMIGRNDVTFGIKGNEASVGDHVVGGVQRLVEWLTPQVKQVMLVGVTTGTNEPAGNANNTTITEINSRLQELMPGKFKSLQAYLKDRALTDMGLTPTADDTAKISAGTLPPQIMEGTDVVHFSKPTAAAIAQYFFAPYLRAKGWVD